MWLNAALLLMFFLPAFAANASPREEPQRVCVLGAGPAGVMTAYRLENRGYAVTVLEKNDYVGGRAYNYEYKGKPVEMGAVLHGSSDFTTLGLMKHFNISVFEYPYYQGNRTVFDSVNGLQQPLPPRAQLQLAEMVEDPTFRSQFVRWLGIVGRYTELVYGPGQVDNIPELQVPTLQWLMANNLTALVPFFAVYGTTYGYGTLDEVPAQYHVKMFNLAWGLSFMNSMPVMRLTETYQVLFQRMAAGLQDVRLNAQITSAQRKGSIVRIAYSTPEAAGACNDCVVTCGRMVVAFPQLLSSLAFMDLEEREASVFAQVQSSDYWSSAVDLSAHLSANGGADSWYTSMARLFKDGQPSPVPDGDAELVLMAEFTPTSTPGVYVCYSYSRTPATEDMVRAKLLEVLPKLLPPGAPPVQQSDIIKVRHWPDYFPHVNGSSLAGGFYRQLESLQGHRGTYYTGGLLSFDTVDWVVRHADEMVKRYF